MAALDPVDRDWLVANSEPVFALVPAARAAAADSLERAEPARFGRIVQALYAAYYVTAAAQAQVRRLAETGPCEPSPHFDRGLLDTVMTTQAGLRRY